MGRKAALAELGERYRDEPSVVTVVGPAGGGKSRLAHRFASDRPRWLAGSTIVVEAESLSSDDDLRLALAHRVGIEASRPPSTSALASALELHAPAMILLDGVDDLSEQARQLVVTLTVEAPSVVWLATARSALGVRGEALFELEPLDTDPDGGEALELFYACCHAQGVPLSDADRPAIVDLVRALGGLPLSIEIAAARCAVVSPAALLGELEGQRGWASLSRHSAPGRGSLGSVIGSALGSLDPSARAALVRLSPCRGGFACDIAEDLSTPADAETVLATLRHRSLLRVSVQRDGARRYGIDASVAAVTLAMAAPSDRDDALVRHAEAFVERALAAAEAVRRRGDVASRGWLAREQQNLVAIVDRAEARLVPRRLGGAALLALEPLWLPQGRARAFVDRLSALGGAAASAFPEPDHRARAALAQGYALGLLGRPTESKRVLAATARRADAAGLSALAAEARLLLSIRLRQQGEVRRALELADRARGVLEQTPYERAHALAMAFAGLSLLQLGQLDASEAMNERARALLKELGDREMEGLALGNLAQVDQERGVFERSRLRFSQSLACLRAAGADVYVASYVGFAAMLAHENGEWAAARQGYDAALAELAAHETRHVEALLRAHRGALSAQLGEEASALEDFDSADASLARGGFATFAHALELHRGQLDVGWARAALARGDAARARAHLERAADRVRAADTLGGEELAFDARFARRLLQRAIETATPREVLAIGPEAAWFRRGSGPRVEIGHRPPLCRLLGALTTQRGQARSVADLVALGWPGEKVLPTAGRRRVQVAISTLRRLGLEGCVVTDGGGYAIHPSVALQLGDLGGA